MATRTIFIPSFYAAATLCLSYMHSHFNYTFMYIQPQLAQPTSAPAHWLTGLSAFCPAPHHPPTPLLRCCYSVYHVCIVTLTIRSCTYYLNWADQPPAHWLTGAIYIVSRQSTNPSVTLLLISVHHICIVTLTISTCTVHTTSISLTNLSVCSLATVMSFYCFISLLTYCSPNTFFALLVRACK